MVEFRLTVSESRVLSRERASRFFLPARLERSVFGFPLPDFRRPVSRRAPTPEPEYPEKSLVTYARRQPSQSDLAAAEIEVRYALHRARVCLGGSVEVARDPPGYISVAGFVETEERKAELLAALHELEALPLVKVDLRTPEPASATESRGAAGQPGKVIVSSPERLPIERELRRYFEKAGIANVEEEITRVSNRAVSLSQAALSEAWALRRLVEAHGPLEGPDLRPHSRWFLEVMLQDHMRALNTRVDSTRALLAPVLQLTADGDAPRVDALQTDETGWSEGCMRVFEQVEHMHGLVLALLVGGDPEHGAEAAGDLTATLQLLAGDLQRLQVRLPREFTGPPGRLSMASEPEEKGR